MAVSELRIGEHLQDENGRAVRVTSIIPRGPPQAVYNLEVHGEHVFRVTTAGLLVHNTKAGAVKNGLSRLKDGANRIAGKLNERRGFGLFLKPKTWLPRNASELATARNNMARALRMARSEKFLRANKLWNNQEAQKAFFGLLRNAKPALGNNAGNAAGYLTDAFTQTKFLGLALSKIPRNLQLHMSCINLHGRQFTEQSTVKVFFYRIFHRVLANVYFCCFEKSFHWGSIVRFDQPQLGRVLSAGGENLRDLSNGQFCTGLGHSRICSDHCNCNGHCFFLHRVACSANRIWYVSASGASRIIFTVHSMDTCNRCIANRLHHGTLRVNSQVFSRSGRSRQVTTFQ